MSGNYLNRLRRCVWGVIFTIALGALTPVVSQLLSARNAVQWQEICTTAGMIRIALTDDESGAPQPVSASFHYCPYCVPHADDLVLPRSDGDWWRVALAVGTFVLTVPVSDYRPDNFPFAASLLYLRAPPALS